MIPDPTSLRTRDAAALLGVHPSTVRRWFGAGEVGARRGEGASAGTARPGSVTTSPGGHRRISLRQLLRVALERGHEVYLHRFGADAARAWNAAQAVAEGDPGPACDALVHWLKARRIPLIGRFLRHLGGEAGAPAPEVLDGVFGGFMRRVGDGWRRGELPIRDERAASREVAETIHTFLLANSRAGAGRDTEWAGAAQDSARAAAGLGPESPAAIVGTIEHDQHVLGSLLVRLTLVQRGWRVEHLGSGVPIAEIVAAQRAVRASLVCVSLTPPKGPADAHRFVEVAGALADPRRPFSLVIGGSAVRGVGLEPRCGPFTRVAVIDSLAGLHRWMDRHAPELPATATRHV